MHINAQLAVLLFSGTLLCTVILTARRKFNASFLYLYAYLFGHVRNKGKDMDSVFINKDIFGEYIIVFVMYILLKVSCISENLCRLQYDVRY